MGQYLNPGNNDFKEILEEKYVDKSMLIDFVNQNLNKKTSKLICVSRPRRFGKTFASFMLSAYYDKSCDSHELFKGLNISKTDSYETNINKHNVIYLDITRFIGPEKDISNIVNSINKKVSIELIENFPIQTDSYYLPDVLDKITLKYGERFIFIIDEWDAIYRQFKNEIRVQEKYVELLRDLFKSPTTGKSITAAYMTGILPIVKYDHQSAVSDFKEYTMTDPRQLAPYYGFTEEEVEKLCEEHSMSFDLMKEWYDGYELNGYSLYNPRSVVEAIDCRRYGNYWTRTSGYDEIKKYLEYDQVTNEDLMKLLSGKSIEVDINTFKNDLIHLDSKDKIFTLLIHYGYFTYDEDTETIRIPNKEIHKEFISTVKESKYTNLSKMIIHSKELIQSTINREEKKVSKAIEYTHSMINNPENYNSEEALRVTIKMAYIASIDHYAYFEELPSGKGYCDIAFIPKDNVQSPILLFELKWNKDTEEALSQIKDKTYSQRLEQFQKEILFIGINYDANTKEHTCKIEKCH